MSYELFVDKVLRCDSKRDFDVALIDSETGHQAIRGVWSKAPLNFLRISGAEVVTVVMTEHDVEVALFEALGRKLTATRTEVGVNIEDFGAVPDSKPALATQVGGSHYKDMPIQPAEYCHKNGIGKLEGDVIAYVSRWRKKNGIEDLKKARHTIDIILELEARR